MHRFKEAGGCEAEMMFVRPGDFRQDLVRSFCSGSVGKVAWLMARSSPCGQPPLPLLRRPTRLLGVGAALLWVLAA